MNDENPISESLPFETFKVGAVVQETGTYVCVPCGYRKDLRKGDRFPSCIRCLGRGGREFRSGLELWEKK